MYKSFMHCIYKCLFINIFFFIMRFYFSLLYISIINYLIIKIDYNYIKNAFYFKIIFSYRDLGLGIGD